MTCLNIEFLKNLNDLGKGIHKHWIYKDFASRQIAGDYLQKMNFSIADLNKTFSKDSFDYKDIVFIICLVDWIGISISKIKGLFKNKIIDHFLFFNQNEFFVSKDYFKAIRSFVVAHPLETNRHNKYSFDGTYICLDLFQNDDPAVKMATGKANDVLYLDYYGLHKGVKECDFYLKTYSSKYYQNQYFLLIGFWLEDIVKYARLCIQEIYELDTFLSKLKMKDFKEVA